MPAWFDNLFVSKADLQRSKEVDAKLAELNQRNVDLGIWTYEEGEASKARLQASDLEAMLHDPATSPSGGFQEGFEEGVSNIQNTVKGTVNAVGGTAARLLFGSIPWWVYVLAILGGGVWVWQRFFKR